MDLRILKHHIDQDDVLSVERQLADESPATVSQEDLGKLIALLTDAVTPNVAMEMVHWLEATDLCLCASALVEALAHGTDPVSLWLEALVDRMANAPAGESALKEVLRGLSHDEMVRASARHERIRHLAPR